MGKKFLIIDDSALMRRVISDIIKANSEYDVLDIATNGLEGFDKLVAHPGYYDLVILDINMPKMNGLEMLEALQKNRMQENVVVVSTVAKEGAVETMRALELGALDFLTKPENFYEVKGDGFKEGLLNLIELVTGKDLNKKVLSAPAKPAERKPLSSFVRTSSSGVTPATRPETRSTPGTAGRVTQSTEPKKPGTPSRSGKLIALACSTGGPKSLQDVIPLLPANLNAPVVLVQHMPKGFTLSLAQRLDQLSAIKVSEAKDGDILEDGHVYIAPGGMHITVVPCKEGHMIRFDDQPPVDSLKPCANIMYNSLVDTKFTKITCVVLTGMGADGTKGIQKLHDAGKPIRVISQTADTCVVYGMPRAVFEAGLTDEVVPLDAVAEHITRSVGVV